MIARLRGHMVECLEDHLIVDAGGVGYRVWISSQTRQTLSTTTDEITLSIHHHITDSDQRLFGFVDERERALFEALITVKGIGPKLALAVLSGLSVEALIRAIESADIKTLASISGIGKKSAERLALELRGGMKLPESSFSESGSRPDSTNGIAHLQAIDALEALGFARGDAEEWVHRALKSNPDASVSEIVRKALTFKS